MSDRIGDPTREKWQPFLDKCLMMGVLAPEEHLHRSQLLLEAKTNAETEKAYKDLSWEPWSVAWNKAREKGLARKTEILPDFPERKIVIPWRLIAITGWALFLCCLICIT